MTTYQKASRLAGYIKEFNQGKSILEISLKNISKNYRVLLDLSKPSETGAVVKANAYGCGIERVGKLLSNIGCEFFFVAKLEEGVELRKYISYSKKIAVFDGYLEPYDSLWKEYNLIPVCNTVHQAIEASKNNIIFMLHIDTGMNRLGLSISEANNLLLNKTKLNHKNLVLILSHFACSDNKLSKLNSIQIRELNKFNYYFPKIKRSISNSHGIFLGNESKFDLTRPGIALYGYTNNENYNLSPAISLYSPILQIRHPNVGETVGYDASYRIKKKSVLGTLGIGYADGFKRCINSRNSLRVGKYRVPILGRVSMDTIVVDLSEIPSKIMSKLNHIPIIDSNYSLKEMADDCSTIPYEIMTSFSSRIKRVYT
ncbi:MAG: alanine racemase [Candidatus Puniceispirillales bacterium]